MTITQILVNPENTELKSEPVKNENEVKTQKPLENSNNQVSEDDKTETADTEITDENISQPRRSTRNNKGIPAERLSLMVQDEIRKESSSWDEMKMLPEDAQKFGEDYEDTFAPVARHTTLRTLLTVAASKKLKVNHFDVKTAFLNGEIKEGLKQSARSWNQKIDSILKSDGFHQSEADLCLYTKKCNNVIVYILLYVDDLLIC
jgi:preprotein translocase subunit SecD